MLKVSFRTSKLEKCFIQHRRGKRTWGPVIAELYIRRIKSVQAVERIDDLKSLPQLYFHPLEGNRAGEWAIKLTGRARIIVKLAVEEGKEEVIIWDVDPKHYEH